MATKAHKGALMTNFSQRVVDISNRMNPIVRSLLDIDFYKLTMHQFIHEKYPNVMVSFQTKNRTSSVKLSDDIDIKELQEQLDHVKSLRFTSSELIWLRGQTFYGKEGVFTQSYINYLRTFSLPDYEIKVVDGDITLLFHGKWEDTTLWEIYALTIINELRYRSIMSKMSYFQLDIMYARAKVKTYNKLLRLSSVDGLNFSDFGTRRRHSFLWQEYCVLTAAELLGDSFKGTSNVLLAMKHGFDAVGSNAHELPSTFAAMANNDEELKQSQYNVLHEWQTMYNGNMLLMLPDTFGTTQFLENAPHWVSYWKGARPDSKEPIAAGEELISFWEKNGVSKQVIANDKLIIFSDGLDINEDDDPLLPLDIVGIHNYFEDKVQVGFGIGTKLTNDFVGCHPDGEMIMKPISLVCKVSHVNDKPAVKLSDVDSKVTSVSPDEIKRYQRVFGDAGILKNALEPVV